MYMPETTVTRTTTNRRPATPVVQDTIIQTDTVASEHVVVASEDFAFAKVFQVLWFITHFIAIMLGLRFVFYLLGANPTGIVSLIYTISEIFVFPFRGIFPSARTGEFFFDSAALLGILMYYLLVFLLTRAVLLFSRNTET